MSEGTTAQNPGPLSERELFERALELDAAARLDFLRAHCADPAVRAQIQRRLNADAASNGLLDRPLDQLVTQVGQAPLDAPAPGDWIGPFQLLEKLGEGGFSFVYRARREQDQVEQIVALKLLRRGIYTADDQRRFRDERRALILLNCPGIARFIEGGTTPAGVPYIAMELIAGLPITAYSARHDLDTPSRLSLFVSLCQAVAFAHQALIVHRDIKPGNVLVNAQGEVKLLDFGIAKLLGDADLDSVTQTQNNALTPAYAAPEQFERGAITTLTDVFALGRLLRELLAAPSTHPLRGARRADLERIIAMASATLPAHRYPSAEALAEDVQRYLSGQVVRAHPPSRVYRLRKFVARNRWAVLASIVFITGLIAALGVSLWQVELARREAARANAVRDFVQGLFDPVRAGTDRSKAPSYSDLIDAGLARIDQTPALGSTGQVDLLIMFSRLYDRLNEREKMLNVSARAHTLADSKLGRLHPLAIQALIAYGTARQRVPNMDSAQTLIAEAVQRLQDAGLRGDPWLRAHNALLVITNARGDVAASLMHAHLALDETRVVFGENSNETRYAMNNVAFALSGNGRFDESIAAYRALSQDALRTESERVTSLGSMAMAELMAGHTGAGLEHLRASVAAQPTLGDKPTALLVTMAQNLCLAEQAAGKSQAGSACNQSLALARSSDGGAGSATGLALRLEGSRLLRAGELAGARAALQQSRELLAAQGSDVWRGRTDIALGQLALLENQPQLAAQELSVGLAHLGHGFPPYLRILALALRAQACATAAVNQNCPVDAEALARTALEQDPYHFNVLLLPARVSLLRIDLQRGAPDEATAAAFAQSLAKIDPAVATTHPDLQEARLWLAVLKAKHGDCAPSAAMPVAPGSHPALVAAQQAWYTFCAH